MERQVGVNLVRKEINNANVINFGGNCHVGYFIKKCFKSPFSGLGFPTSVLPYFLNSNWKEDFFNLENLIVFRDVLGGVCVRDLKYNVNSHNHFEAKECANLIDVVKEKLDRFKAEFINRWDNLLIQIENPHNFIVYNEYYPLWLENNKVGLQEAVDSILALKPKAQLIVVCEDKKQLFENVATVIKNPKDDETADLWDFIVNNIEQRSFYSGRRYFFRKKNFI